MKYTIIHSATATDDFIILAPMGGNVSFNILTPIKKGLILADKPPCSDRYKKMFILDVIVEFAFTAAHVVDVYNIVKSAVFVDIFKHIPQFLQLIGRKMQRFTVIEYSRVQYFCLY